jgi:hypothetical protein
MKVAILCHKDQAGSGMMFARTLRHHGHEATLYTKTAHGFGYEYDVLLDHRGPMTKRRAKEELGAFDVIHFKGDQLPFTGPYKALKNIKSPPAVITVGGSGFRRRNPQYPTEACQHWYPVSRYRGLVSGMSAITPDLMYAPDIALVPHAHHEVESAYQHRQIPVLGHSPSHRLKKGTDNLFLPAVEILRARGVKFQLKVIEGVDNASCIKAKSECSVIFDQAVIPAYGMNAVEAMMMGIPVVTRMTHEVRQRDPLLMQSPIFTFQHQSPTEIADALQEALGGDLRRASHDIREWAMEMHSYAGVHPRLIALYSKALTSQSRQRQWSRSSRQHHQRQMPPR